MLVSPGHLFQDHIANLVAVQVVKKFEVIDVDHDQGKLAVCLPLQAPLQLFIEAQAVVDLGQSINSGFLFQKTHMGQTQNQDRD